MSADVFAKLFSILSERSWKLWESQMIEKEKILHPPTK